MLKLLAAAIGITLTMVVGGMVVAARYGTAGSCAASTTVPAPLAHRGITPAMMDNATTIVSVGAQLQIPERGATIAVATALQESRLRVLANPTVPASMTLPHQGVASDHDSVGLFQQRPNWGTTAELMNPAISTRKFYTKLLQVPHWQTRPLTEVAQAVQVSAYPDAYATWESLATLIVAAITPGLVASCTAGTAVLSRAAKWLTAWHGGPVPYLSSSDPGTWLGGYRRDCSGYAAMALGLPAPGPDTAGLAGLSTSIPPALLRAGDLLINPAPGPAGHVVIFDHWADATMTRYWGYEQAPGGTTHRVIAYPYEGSYPLFPYRPRPPQPGR